ncbi:MAG: manganese efflux pump MntP family protein [Pseudomonadota bacterium]|jgi:manganese efflux pump family protein|nr:manganese efflux pump MntP family protein [Pseudomonadota bacterium]
MSPLSITVLAFSMSADACAAAMARGATTKPSFLQAAKGGLVFGIIETVTPLLGWMLGLAASAYITAIDHWIAFGLLSLVGGKMALNAGQRLVARSSVDETDTDEVVSKHKGMLALILTAFATSIDAAAVGVTLAFVDVNIVSVALAIGLTTFVLATGGLMIGKIVGVKFGPVVELIGGLGLMAIGTGILLDHTGILA